jgi:hypothetical protein
MSLRAHFTRAAVFVALLCCSAGLASAQSGSGGSAPTATTPQSQTGNNGTPSDKPAAQAPSSKDKSKADASVPDDPSMTKIRLRVTNNQDKPVPNASVYIRYNESGGLFHKDHLSEMNFKTNDDGSVKVPEVPIGKVLIQIVAKGYHTYGKWYDIAKDPDEISIKLDPPPHWY